MFQRFLLRQYYKIYRLDNWTRRHFTFSGHLVVIVMFAAMIFGVDTKHSNTYQLFVFLLILLSLAIINSFFNRLKVSIKRQLPRYGTVAEPLTYSVTLKNKTNKYYDKLTLIERLQDDFPEAHQLHDFYQQKGIINFRKWRKFLSYQRGGVIDETPLATLTHKPLQINVSFTPIRRGKMTLDNSYLAKPDILGLFRKLILLDDKQSLIVLPQRYPIKPLKLAGKRKYQAGGVSLANSVGDSSEFMSLRDYQQGDALNTIHWKSYAKHGKLIVKEYQDEYFVRRALLLDTFVGNKDREQFEAAVSVAASIAITERQNEALLDLMFVGLETYRFTTGRGVDHLPHLQEILASVQASSESAFEKLQKAVLTNSGCCSSFVCVLMHWDEPRQNLIKQLLGNDLPVAVFLLDDGTLNLEQCEYKPEHFYLLNYHHLAADLAAI
ncbi:MAG: DUF58 domain-containing protein [Methylococcaceae bacterium]|nr:DUF58 domain-containing protein [Methylococcaceae bacterium]